jgi:hypothetical protein
MWAESLPSLLDVTVASLLQELAKTEFSRDAAQKFPWVEVNRARGGCRLSAGLFGDLRNIIASILRRVAVDGGRGREQQALWPSVSLPG